MQITTISFENFRNLLNGSISPGGGINVIWGDNAQGKTNLLEAVWLFTGGHSFRGNKDAELPRLEEGKNLPEARLQAQFFSGGREQSAVLNIQGGKRSSVINGVEKKTGSALVGKLCAVIFSPEHLLLVKEGPSKRRSFLDGAICQIRPAYAKLLAKYNRSLAQRNTLIKDIFRYPELRDTMEIWNERLVLSGSQVIRERLRYVGRIAPRAEEIYGGISKEKEKLSIRYDTSVFQNPETLEEEFRDALKRTEKTDLKLGFTSVGPHRDDLELQLSGLSARTYGSQGQQRSAVLALKLAEADLLEESAGEPPLILLDDVMSELDQSRQDYLLNHLNGRQIFITCCSPETVNLMERGRAFYVEGGSVRESGLFERNNGSPQESGQESENPFFRKEEGQLSGQPDNLR